MQASHNELSLSILQRHMARSISSVIGLNLHKNISYTTILLYK